MNPINLLALSGYAHSTLMLASKSATTEGDWLAINQVASNLLGGLAAIENDPCLLANLRAEACQQRANLRSIQQSSNDEYGRLRAQRITP